MGENKTTEDNLDGASQVSADSRISISDVDTVIMQEIIFYDYIYNRW